MALGDLKPKKVAAVVKANLAEIEASLARGLSREQVWEELRKEHQLTTMTFHAFYTALQRKRREQPKASPPAPSLDRKNPEAIIQPEEVDSAIQKAEESKSAPDKVDCAIQKKEEVPPKGEAEGKRKNQIRSTKEIRDSSTIDFSELGKSKY